MITRKLGLTALLFLFLGTFGGTVCGQRINDDLEPESKPTKPKAATKSSIKTSVKPTRKGSRQARPPKPSTSQATGTAVRPNRDSNGAAPSASGETPDQIINRYMNFQQTSGVTTRDWKSVIAQTTKTLQDNPNHSTAKAQALIAQGQIAFNQQSYPAAISYFKSALQILPTSSLPQYSLGKVYLANGQAKAAEQAFKEAIDQNEGFALAYKGMGDALVAQGENKKATKFFKKATEASVRKGSLP